ncbi:imidazole glycerol phosphate synthase subunit HisH [Sandaracinus amylolyticus]|uniref:imidazole glycerol phosphate synthase subunit HisH n=1 Tax=Sandaracinus amylolyticus TaxID=927083 RepID=UPI001F02C344|nr:imidazole glycerol phosphate synthase subunit HisH [Sandaracinus amylolyticus]UJR80704.1 Imidazole glycerol phosphate synthase amidotransferase subunit [Sandaracinus amylolyticus]
MSAATREVVVVDLGMGNLRSVARALERAGASARISSDADVIANAPRLVVPGQGQFRDCATALEGELGGAVRAFVASGRPYLGICLGMQALFASSEEAPGMAGLGIFDGTVKRFARDLRDAGGERLKVPHMGWAELALPASPHPLLRSEPRWFYFVHSYVCVPDDAGIIAATADHGGAFCAAVARENVFACQFHPEKSGAAGHALLTRYLEGAWS